MVQWRKVVALAMCGVIASGTLSYVVDAEELNGKVEVVAISNVDKVESDGQEVPVEFQIKMNPQEGAKIAGIQFELEASEGLTIEETIPLQTIVKEVDSGLIYNMYDDTGIFSYYNYTNKMLLATAQADSGVFRFLTDEAMVLKVDGTVDADFAGEVTLTAKNIITAKDGSGTKYPATAVPATIKVYNKVKGTQIITGITSPTKNEVPDTTVTVGKNMSATVSWVDDNENPVTSNFEGGKEYTAIINVTPKEYYVWDENVTFQIDGEIWKASKEGTGYKLSKTFAATESKLISELSVEGTLEKTNYVEGDEVNTNGLIVRAKYDDGSSEVINNAQYTITPNPLVYGTETIIIKYLNKGIEVTGIKVKKIPTNSDINVSIPTDSSYDGTSKNATITSANVGMGNITVLYDGKSEKPTQAGEYKVTVNIEEGVNYTAIEDLEVGTLIIKKKDVTLPMASVIAKKYDESNDAKIIPGNMSGVLESDQAFVAISETDIMGVFDNEFVGVNKSVTTSNVFTLKGSASNNYNLVQPSGLEGVIQATNQKPIFTSGTSLTKAGATLDLRTLVEAEGNCKFTIAENDTDTILKSDGYTVESGNDLGTVIFTVNIDGVDVNKDAINEYNAFKGTKAISVEIVDKINEKVVIEQKNTTYGNTLEQPVYTMPEGAKEVSVLYSGTETDGDIYGASKEKPTQAGEYKVAIVLESDTHRYTGEADFEIKQKDISDATIILGDTLVYSGVTQTQVVDSVKDGAEIIDAQEYSITKNAAKNAGGYNLKITANSNKNYYGELEQRFDVQKAEIDIQSVTIDDKNFDGNTEAAVSNVVFNGLKGDALNQNVDFKVVNAAFAKYTVGMDINVSGEIILNQTDITANYELKKNQFPLTTTGNIIKADSPIVEPIELSVKYADVQQKNVGLEQLIPSEAGNIEKITCKIIQDSNNIIASCNSNKDSKELYISLANNLVKFGQNATIEAAISTQNYKDIIVMIEVITTDKDVPAILVNDLEKTYDAIAYSDNDIVGKASFGTESIKGTWSFDGAYDLTNANEGIQVVVKFIPEDAVNFAEVKQTINVTIHKAVTVGEPSYQKVHEAGKTLAEVVLGIGSISPIGGVIEWDLPENTEILDGVAYAWTYTPDADMRCNYTVLSGEIKPWFEPPVDGYKVLVGDEQVIKNLKEDIKFELSVPVDRLDKITIDDVIIDNVEIIESDEGNTIIKLNSEYLKTLSKGKHIITVYAADGGVVSSAFYMEVVNNNWIDSVVGTGDYSSSMLWIMVMSMAMISGIVVIRKRKA